MLLPINVKCRDEFEQFITTLFETCDLSVTFETFTTIARQPRLCAPEYTPARKVKVSPGVSRDCASAYELFESTIHSSASERPQNQAVTQSKMADFISVTARLREPTSGPALARPDPQEILNAGCRRAPPECRETGVCLAQGRNNSS